MSEVLLRSTRASRGLCWPRSCSHFKHLLVTLCSSLTRALRECFYSHAKPIEASELFGGHPGTNINKIYITVVQIYCKVQQRKLASTPLAGQRSTHSGRLLSLTVALRNSGIPLFLQPSSCITTLCMIRAINSCWIVKPASFKLDDVSFIGWFLIS